MNERIETVIKHPAFLPSVVGVVSFGIGVGAGYILGRREKYEEFSEPKPFGMTLDENDLAELREMQLLDEEDEEEADVSHIHPPIDAKEFIARRLQLSTQDDESEIEERNVFAGTDDEWNFEEEVKARQTDQPYVLHKDEFYAVERPDYTQLTLTYFVGDEVLVDQDEKPIYPHQNITGPLPFGHGSGDPNVVYIRNEKLKAEYEVIKMDAMYAVEVLGLEEDHERAKNVVHSNTPRFRPTD